MKKIRIVVTESSEIDIKIGNININPGENIFCIPEKTKKVIDETINKMIEEKKLKPIASWRYSKIPGPGKPPFNQYPIITL